MTERNADEVYRVPLFIKAPGQVAGEVVDDTAMTIDVLPSIDRPPRRRVDWEMDGHSLYDGSEATVEPKVSTDVADVLAIAARAPRSSRTATTGRRSPPSVHTAISSARVSPTSTSARRRRGTARLDQRELFGDLPTADGELPLVLAGSVDRSAQTATSHPNCSSR